MGLKAIKILLKTIIILLMLTVSTVIFAGSVWDGSVSIARYGYLPHTGMYAASNAFSQNSRITVTNPKTGKSVNVTVLERLEDNNLFLVLSSEAAESIGISYGDIFHGTITEQAVIGPGSEEDLPFNPDPDVNPSAPSEGYSELALIQDYIETELGGVDDDSITTDTEIQPEIPDEYITEEIEVPDEVIEEAVDFIEIVPEVVEEPVVVEEPEVVEEAEIVEEPEVVEEVVPIEEVIPEIEEPVEPIEMVIEPIEEEIDTPLVENMPLEDVYNSEPDLLLPAPDIVESVPASLDGEPVIEDIPEAVSMDASVPSIVVLAPDVGDNVPELPEPETDTPVVTMMGVEDTEVIDTEIAISELPELPIIGVEEALSDEKPIAVSMTADVVTIEEVEDISHILPEVVSIEEESELPEIDEFLALEPDVEDEIVMTVAEPEIEVPEEEIIVVEEPEPVEEIAMDVEVVLEPSDPRPPVVEIEDETEVVDTEETAPVSVVDELVEDEVSGVDEYSLTRKLVKDSYYLQLAAYREQYSALDLAGQLDGMYPVTVYISESSDTLNYKVMVGPLGQDESGAVLYSFKSSGYPDAFLRKGL